MNLILLFPDDMAGEGRARLTGRRQSHVRDVLKARPGDTLTVGMVAGKIGTGRVARFDGDVLEMDIALDRDPPAAMPVTVVLALPRPKVLRRVLFSLAVLGVKRIVLVNAARVEKSYWQSPFLAPDAVRRQLVLGLEQARDTVMPDVELKQRFKPFVEDELPGLAAGMLALVAHPYASSPCPSGVPDPVILAIGPEGGFVPYEREMFMKLGFRPVSLGERSLHVEVAVHALLGRLMPDVKNASKNLSSPV